MTASTTVSEWSSFSWELVCRGLHPKTRITVNEEEMDGISLELCVDNPKTSTRAQCNAYIWQELLRYFIDRGIYEFQRIRFMYEVEEFAPLSWWDRLQSELYFLIRGPRAVRISTPRKVKMMRFAEVHHVQVHEVGEPDEIVQFMLTLDEARTLPHMKEDVVRPKFLKTGHSWKLPIRLSQILEIQLPEPTFCRK